jgi:proline iminopeptidase
VISHGRLDLARAWPRAELVVSDDSGHAGSDSMRAAALAAIERFKPGATAS